ncbi:site-specific DNA-methyltransferase [bacterium]|nr:site-specific DNA-methyltransferase [bacterium]
MNRGGLEINEVHHGDCLELLQQLPDGCADLIFADPPYNLQLSKDLFRPDKSLVGAVDEGWDKFDSFSSYDHFTRAWLLQCRRVLKENGTIWVIGTYHNIFRIGAAMQDTGFWILNDIIWIKTNPTPNFMGTRFANAHETMIWASKSKEAKYTFHYQPMKGFNDDLQMRSDWLIPVCKGPERIREEGKKAHPTQKPGELLNRVIMATTNHGDLIVDPFAGSGTSAAVAKRLGRNFIAIERELSYVSLARERVSSITPLERPLLEYRTERRVPRVPFGNLVESGLIIPGENLWSADGKYAAEVQADASIRWEGKSGSIHSIGSLVSGKEKQNGWDFWYVNRDNRMVNINEIRHHYIRKYLA